MTSTNWNIDNITVEEIADHLKKFHAVSFDSRESLTDDEFVEVHFPNLVKDVESLRMAKLYIAQKREEVKTKLLSSGKNGYEANVAANKSVKLLPQIEPDGMARLRRARGLLKRALVFCEENRIPVTRVIDQVSNGDWEWRICKPNAAQVELMRIKRWYGSIEGYFNKAVNQQNLLEDADTDLLLDELKASIKVRQDGRKKPNRKDTTSTEPR